MYNKNATLLCHNTELFYVKKITLQVTAVHLSHINQNEDTISSLDQ